MEFLEITKAVNGLNWPEIKKSCTANEAYSLDDFGRDFAYLIGPNGPFISTVSAYKKSLTVNAGIRMIASSVADLDIELVDSKGQEVEGNEIAQKFLVQPNQTDTKRSFLEWLITWLYLRGNSYVRVVGANESAAARGKSRIAGLIPEYSDSIRIEPDSHVNPEYVLYYENQIKGARYEPFEIMHFRFFNPVSRVEGRSFIESAFDEIRQNEAMSRFQRRVAEEGSLPGGVYSTDNTDITQDQYNAMLRLIKEKSTGKNSGAPLVLTGGMKPIPTSFKPSDMEMLNSQIFTHSLILMMLGIPPLIMGSIEQSKNQHTYQEAVKQFYNNTVLPVSTLVLEVVNRYFFYDGKLKFRVNKNSVDALKSTSQDLSAAWWLSGNERRAMQGVPASTDMEMDKIFIPANFVPLEAAGMGNASEV